MDRVLTQVHNAIAALEYVDFEYSDLDTWEIEAFKEVLSALDGIKKRLISDQ